MRCVIAIACGGLLVTSLTAMASLSSQQSTPPKRPTDFKPFQFEYTTEQLKEKFSDAQMKRAARELK